STLGRIWMQNRDVPVEQHVRAILDQVDPRLADGLAPERLAALVRAYADPALAVPPTVDDGALGALQALAARGLTLAVVSNIMRSPGATLRKILAHYRLLPYFSVLTFSDECRIRKPACGHSPRAPSAPRSGWRCSGRAARPRPSRTSVSPSRPSRPTRRSGTIWASRSFGSGRPSRRSASSASPFVWTPPTWTPRRTSRRSSTTTRAVGREGARGRPGALPPRVRGAGRDLAPPPAPGTVHGPARALPG